MSLLRAEFSLDGIGRESWRDSNRDSDSIAGFEGGSHSVWPGMQVASSGSREWPLASSQQGNGGLRPTTAWTWILPTTGRTWRWIPLWTLQVSARFHQHLDLGRAWRTQLHPHRLPTYYFEIIVDVGSRHRVWGYSLCRLEN